MSDSLDVGSNWTIAPSPPQPGLVDNGLGQASADQITPQWFIEYLRREWKRVVGTGALTVSAIRSVQSGYVAGAGSSASTGENARYLDTTITAVADTAKCVVTILQQGGADTAATNGHLTSTTNLRVTAASGVTFNAFRSYIVEYL